MTQREAGRMANRMAGGGAGHGGRNLDLWPRFKPSGRPSVRPIDQPSAAPRPAGCPSLQTPLHRARRTGVATLWGRLLGSRPANAGEVHSGAANPFGETLSLASGAACGAAGARAGRSRGDSIGDEFGHKVLGAPRFGRFGRVPTSRGPWRHGAAFEHPASKQRQCCFFRHFFEQNGQLPAQIGNVFQFGDLEVSQRCTRAFSKIVHRRFAGPGHRVSPEDWVALVVKKLPGRVTQSQSCANLIVPVENSGASGSR